LIFALAELVESPGGAIWTRAANGNCEFARCWNIPEIEVDRRWDAAPFCDALSHSGVVIDVDGSSRDASLSGSVLMPAWMHNNPSLWLVIPLFHEERLMGFVILSKARAPQALDWENVQLLQTAARQAASYLALDEAATALAQARQFEGFNRLSAFVVHDLKNLIAQLSLITKNAERFKGNQAFVDDAFQTVRNSVDKMNRLLAQLRSAAGSGHAARVDLRATLERVISDRCTMEPRPSLRIDADLAVAVSADSDRLSAVLGNVIQNAQRPRPRTGASMFACRPPRWGSSSK
jgi:putative PEP-CTERM system histidine kinase